MSSKSKSVQSKKDKKCQDRQGPNESCTTINRNKFGGNYQEELAEDVDGMRGFVGGFDLNNPNGKADLTNNEGSFNQFTSKGQKQQKAENQNPEQKQSQPSQDLHKPHNVSRAQCLKKMVPECKRFKALSRKKKVATIVVAFFAAIAVITISIVLPIILSLRDQPKPEWLGLTEIYLKGKAMLIAQTEVIRNNHTHTIHGIGSSKVESTHFTLEAITKMLRLPDNDFEIHFNVPILSVFHNFAIEHKQEQAFQDWLDEYNKNPRQNIDKLIDTIQKLLTKPGTRKFNRTIPDNLTFVSVKEEIEIDLQYDPIEQKFVVSRFESEQFDHFKKQHMKTEENAVKNNLKVDEKKSQNQTRDSKKESTEANKETQVEQKKNYTSDNKDSKTSQNKNIEKKDLMTRVMVQTVYYLKRVVARNVEALRTRSGEIISYQQKIADESSIEQEWQQALIKGCRTVESLRFRCTLEAAEKLVPGLTREKIQSQPDFIISQTLSLVFKEVKETSE